MVDITPFGFWLLVDDGEHFVPFDAYPEFRAATVAQICAIERIGPGQIHWPDLDIDIETDALDQPHAYPLAFKR